MPKRKTSTSKRTSDMACRKISRKVSQYDCSVQLKLKFPRAKHVKPDVLYRSTLMALAHEFFAKYPEDQELLALIYRILKKTISASKTDFRSSKRKRGLNVKLQRRRSDVAPALTANI